MPQADQYLTENTAVRAFIYGHDKSRKTTWAVQAAEAGYRVLLFDFNRGAAALQQLTPEARQRVFVIEASDAYNDAFAARVATFALKNHEFWFADDGSHRIALQQQAGLLHCNMREFGRETVVVFDSYTDLVVSLARQYAFDNNIDLSDAQKPEWEGYRWCGALAQWLLTQMRALPCHVVVIGHATQYEKYKRDPSNPKRQGPLEWSRKQPVSTSNPHGMSITRDFDHVLQFYIQGRTCYIDARGNEHEAGGSRVLGQERYQFDTLPFVTLAQAMGINPPNPPVEPFQFVPAEAGRTQSPSPTKPPLLKPQQGRASILTRR